MKRTISKASGLTRNCYVGKIDLVEKKHDKFIKQAATIQNSNEKLAYRNNKAFLRTSGSSTCQLKRPI